MASNTDGIGQVQQRSAARGVASLVLTGLAALALGCGEGWLPETPTDSRPPAEAEAEPAPTTARSTDKSWLASVKDVVNSFEGEPEEAPPDPDAAPVKCDLKGTVTFMSRSDCLARKGKPF